MGAYSEVEFTTLRSRGSLGSGGARLSASARAVVHDFFDGLKAGHKREADRLRRLNASVSSSKRNLQKLYLDDERRAAAAEASMRHLEAHPEWISRQSLQHPEDLLERVALQHFIAVDMEDLNLPEDERRSNDSFTEQGIAEQFILDAGRSTFIIAEQEYSFNVDLEGTGVTFEDDPLKIEHLREAFEERLVAALLSSLRPDAPKLLLQGVSRLMSQSGMANLERACSGTQVIVSGGEQGLRYELLAASRDVWEVRAFMHKEQFEDILVLEETDAGKPEKVLPLSCSPASFIRRSFSTRFSLHQGGVFVDLCGFSNEVRIFDTKGQPITLPGQAPTRKMRPWRKTVARYVLQGVKHLVPTSFFRCGHCQRRAAAPHDRLCRQALSSDTPGPPGEATSSECSPHLGSAEQPRKDEAEGTPLTESLV